MRIFTLLLFLLFLIPCVLTGQSTSPSDFATVRQNHAATKALQKRLQDYLDQGADQIVIEEQAYRTMVFAWEMEELRKKSRRYASIV